MRCHGQEDRDLTFSAMMFLNSVKQIFWVASHGYRVHATLPTGVKSNKLDLTFFLGRIMPFNIDLFANFYIILADSHILIQFLGILSAGIIKGNLRPEIPSWCEPTWRSLMERCWSSDPKSRPAFPEITKELRAMAAAMSIK